MSSKGQVVIPQEVREQCGLREGDHFLIEHSSEDQVISLRKIPSKKPWIEVYLECPGSFVVPKRRRQFYRKNALAR